MLIKYTGKYVKIYFIIKITFLSTALYFLSLLKENIFSFLFCFSFFLTGLIFLLEPFWFRALCFSS